MEIIKDLEYWKKNCEENYITTPISVLRYITELEKWQQEKIYSEEEVLLLLDKRTDSVFRNSASYVDAKEWFKQFKK